MARSLDVYLHRELVGHFIQDDGGQMVFDYAECCLQRPDGDGRRSHFFVATR